MSPRFQASACCFSTAPISLAMSSPVAVAGMQTPAATSNSASPVLKWVVIDSSFGFFRFIRHFCRQNRQNTHSFPRQNIVRSFAFNYDRHYLSAWNATPAATSSRQPCAEHTAPTDREAVEANVSMFRSLRGRAGGPVRGMQYKVCARPLRPRNLLLETLEDRALLTYAYPYGAMPDDTGEYMLGDVAVNVVLMESDSSLAPRDNLPVAQGGRGSPVEDWTASSIAAAKANVQAGLQWWKDTLANMFPSAPANLLNFHINYQYADSPVHTGYEPIDRVSNDFASWIYDFLNQVHFNTTGDFSRDIRAYNDFTRQQTNSDWAFTIFVVNNANDYATTATSSAAGVLNATQFNGGTSLSSTDDAYIGKDVVFTSGALNGQRGHIVDYIGATRTFMFAPNTFSAAPAVGDTFRVESFDGQFAPGGSFSQAFSFAGGRFMVVPASRPPATWAHETGHQFWALDEYLGGGTYSSQRGYYNTPNLNAADNPDPGFVQADSVMSNGVPMASSYANHTLDPYAMAMVGWQDSDHDGIFDVLDVPFTLSGSGQYNATT